MEYIYAVLRERNGAHESQDVMSVWKTEESAVKECAKLNTEQCKDDFEITKWTLNKSGDTINW